MSNPKLTPTHALPIGRRVMLKRSVERYPHFTAPAGATGVVTVSQPDLVAVRLEEPLQGAEAWDNEVCWDDGNGRPALDEARAATIPCDVPNDAPSSVLRDRGWGLWHMGGNYFVYGYSLKGEREGEWVIASGDMGLLRFEDPVVLGLYATAYLDGDEPKVEITLSIDDLLAHSAHEWLMRLKAGTV